MIPAILLALALGALVVVRLRTLLTYYQQEEYNSARFARAVLRVRLYDVAASGVLLATALLAPLGVIVPILATAGLLAIAWRENGYRYKKPLVMTERARRIYGLALVLVALPVAASVLSPLIGIVALQGAGLALVGANALLQPLQERINRRYVAEAKAKLARMDPVRIGITGSFGKTTVKHILSEILEVAGPVFYSRGSINTELGLTRHIRQRLQWAHRYFVAEMGAYGIGSIKRLCRFAQPTYGIVTAVGDAHTERFGSIANIAIAKCELPEAVVAKGGHAVIAQQVMDFAPFQKVKAAYPDQITVVGAEDGADVRVVSATLTQGVWEIALHDTVTGTELTYQLPLLGDHNVMNSALATVMALRIDPTIAARLPLVTKEVEQIPHRLQKRETPGQPLILDDAFNSNETGFRNAVGVLSTLARERGGRAILVTPGIAELGLEHDRVHEAIGRACSGLCDAVYVVNPGRIPTFVKALDRSATEVHEVPSLADARKALHGATAPEDVVLYENDLPDLLEERRLL